MSKRNILCAFAAGLLGGIASHYVSPQPAHAESSAPRELRAESFVLVNEKGLVIGTLTDEAGRPALKLFDERGREIWSAGGKIGIRTAAVGK